MKPKDIAEALIPFKEYIHHNVLIISLLAGVSTHSIKNLLQKTFRLFEQCQIHLQLF